MEQRSRLQNYWLIGLAVMTLLVAVLLAISRSQKGVLFHDALLRAEEQGETRIYSGKSHGAQIRIKTHKTSETETIVDVVIGGAAHANYLVEYPLEPLGTEHGQKPGLRISRDGKVLFNGACNPDAYIDGMGYMLYNEHGVWDVNFDSMFQTENNYGGGYWDNYEMDVSTLLEFACEPQLKARGNVLFFFYGLLMTVLAAVMVAFPNTMFQWNHRWYVKNPEPTEFYFSMNWFGCGLLTVFALVAYIVALRTIP